MFLKFRQRRLFRYSLVAFLTLIFWSGALVFSKYKIFYQRSNRQDREHSLGIYTRKQQEILHLKKHLHLYHKAKKAGLLDSHDRQKLQKILEKLTRERKLDTLHFKMSLTKRRVFPSPKSKITFAYQDTPLSVTFEHSQDVDVFKFIDMLPAYLPGFIVPEQLSLLRSTSHANKKKEGVQGRYDFHLITWDENS